MGIVTWGYHLYLTSTIFITKFQIFFIKMDSKGKQPTSLVTGGAGFIGAHVAEHLLKQGHNVVVLDDLSGGFKDNVPEGSEFVKGSILNVELLQHLFDKHKFDYVFHLAAYAAEGLSHFIRTFNYQNNLIGSMNVINASVQHDIKCLVFTSSIAVYGKNQLPMKEDLTPTPEDPYGISKYAVELDLKAAHEMWGLNSIVFRPHNCYDKETEILTNQGFKLIKDVTKNDFLATLNPHTCALEYHQPTATQKIKFDGKLFHFNSKSFDLMVTPDHKIWCKETPRSEYKFIEAKDLVKKKTSYSTRLSRFVKNWVGEDKPYFIIPELRDQKGRSMINHHQKGWEKVVPMKKWMEFLGWFISEGSMFKTGRNYIISISQSESKNKKNFYRILNLVKEIGFNPYYIQDKKEIRIFSKQMYDCLKKWFVKGSKNKHIPYEFKQLSKEYLEVLYSTLMKGGGDKSGKRYSTNSKQLTDDFCELILKVGDSCTVSNDSGCYRIWISEENQPQLGDNRTKKLHVTKVGYKDYVYDVTVPNHIIFVRRSGKCCWSSNCYGEKQHIGDKYRNVLGIFMNKLMLDEPLTIFGDGKQTRAFTHIDDVAPIIANSINKQEAYNQTFNIGADKEYTVLELAETVSKAFGIEPKLTHLEQRKEVVHAYADHSKVKEMFNLSEAITLQEGVQRMAEWAKKTGSRPSSEFGNIEVTKNLPDSWIKS